MRTSTKNQAYYSQFSSTDYNPAYGEIDSEVEENLTYAKMVRNAKAKEREQQIRDLIAQAKGRFFKVSFVKKDGSIRNMVCRKGVKIGVNGNGGHYNPNQVRVYDVQKQAWRSFNIQSVQVFKCGSLQYGLDLPF